MLALIQTHSSSLGSCTHRLKPPLNLIIPIHEATPALHPPLLQPKTLQPIPLFAAHPPQPPHVLPVFVPQLLDFPRAAVIRQLDRRGQGGAVCVEEVPEAVVGVDVDGTPLRGVEDGLGEGGGDGRVQTGAFGGWAEILDPSGWGEV